MESLRQPYLQKKGKKRKDKKKEKKEHMKKEKLIVKKDGKDNIRCLNRLKTEGRPMQKLEESH